jgi:citrate/tricarballylate utilization protein
MSLIPSLVRLKNVLDEAVRQYWICNACRLCNDLCPVFTVMSSKPIIEHRDTVLLANLCYDHRDCYYSCPYVPPHEFSVNIPEINRRVRLETYSNLNFNIIKTMWGKVILAALTIPIILMWIIYGKNIFVGGPISFYRLIPKDVIVIAGTISVLYIIAWAIAILARYDRMLGPGYRPSLSTLPRTLKNIFLHHWFEKIHYPGDEWGNTRYVYHILIFYGLGLDIIATILGFYYEDFLHIMSPFSLANPVVIIGIVGGVMIIIGTVIAFYARYVSAISQRFMPISAIDFAFAIVLFLVALTGVLVLLFRVFYPSEPYLTYTILLIHLTLVYYFFILAPFTTTMPHILVRAWSLWIYETIVSRNWKIEPGRMLVNLPKHKHTKNPNKHVPTYRR